MRLLILVRMMTMTRIMVMITTGTPQLRKVVLALLRMLFVLQWCVRVIKTDPWRRTDSSKKRHSQ